MAIYVLSNPVLFSFIMCTAIGICLGGCTSPRFDRDEIIYVPDRASENKKDDVNQSIMQ